MEPAPRRTARLVFVGDISAVANRAAPIVDPALRELFASADLVIGNCESPVVERPCHGFATRLGTRHAMTARFLDEMLTASGIDRRKLVLSLANNHALDQGAVGFEETFGALETLGIRAIGLAGEPVVSVQAGALRLGLAAFTQWRNAGADEFESRISMASDPAAWPGGAVRGHDLLCAVPHWDWEFRHVPRRATRALARKLADAGVGLVVGSHAHVVQPLERIGDTLVAYGLGDFLGTALARQPWPGRIGAVLAVDVSLDKATRGGIAGCRLHPFFRLREMERERLVPVGALGDGLRDKVARRLAAVLGDDGTA